MTSCRGVKSSARIVHTGVPQGSKLSPSLFSFYLADMPKPTYSVKRICYTDDISVWASGAKMPELEVKINDYLEKMSEFLKSNSLLISAPKSTVTLFTPETKQAKYHPDIKIAGSQLPLNRSPKILNFQRALHTSGNKSQQQKQRLEGLGRHYLGTTEGDDTDDLQGNRKVGRKLRCPSLEYQCKRHQHRKNSNCAERSPENSYRISQDVKHRSPPQ